MRLNEISNVECAKANEEGYEKMYRDLEGNVPKKKYKFTKLGRGG